MAWNSRQLVILFKYNVLQIYQKQFVLIQICDANKHLLLKVPWCVLPETEMF